MAEQKPSLEAMTEATEGLKVPLHYDRPSGVIEDESGMAVAVVCKHNESAGIERAYAIVTAVNSHATLQQQLAEAKKDAEHTHGVLRSAERDYKTRLAQAKAALRADSADNLAALNKAISEAAQYKAHRDRLAEALRTAINRLSRYESELPNANDDLRAALTAPVAAGGQKHE